MSKQPCAHCWGTGRMSRGHTTAKCTVCNGTGKV